jgi:hypothetical protein
MRPSRRAHAVRFDAGHLKSVWINLIFVVGAVMLIGWGILAP